MAKTSKCSKLLPYHIIAAAASSDVEAINMVLKHYEGYIAALVQENSMMSTVIRTIALMKPCVAD